MVLQISFWASLWTKFSRMFECRCSWVHFWFQSKEGPCLCSKHMDSRGSLLMEKNQNKLVKRLWCSHLWGWRRSFKSDPKRWANCFLLFFSIVKIPVDHMILSPSQELIQIISRLSFLLLVQNRLLVCLPRSDSRCCNSHYGSWWCKKLSNLLRCQRAIKMTG